MYRVIEKVQEKSKRGRRGRDDTLLVESEKKGKYYNYAYGLDGRKGARVKEETISKVQEEIPDTYSKREIGMSMQIQQALPNPDTLGAVTLFGVNPVSHRHMSNL